MVSDKSGLDAHFDLRASHYAAGLSWTSEERGASDLASALSQPTDVMVEFGCGTMNFTAAVCSVLASSSPRLCVGIDLSDRMLTRAAGGSRVRGQIESAPLRHRCADVVLARQIVHYVGRNSTFSSMSRVARDGALACVVQVSALDDDDDLTWMRAVSQLRQPLRRDWFRSSDLVDAITSSGFEVLSHRQERSDALLSDWLGRYEVGVDARAAIERLFEEAPDSVRHLRRIERLHGSWRYQTNWNVIVCRRSTRQEPTQTPLPTVERSTHRDRPESSPQDAQGQASRSWLV